MLAHASASGGDSASQNPDNAGNPINPSFGEIHESNEQFHASNSHEPSVRLPHAPTSTQHEFHDRPRPYYLEVGQQLDHTRQSFYQFGTPWDNQMEREDNIALYGRHTTHAAGYETFLMPAYLHGSSYMRRVVQRQNAKDAQRARADAASNGHSSTRPSRSASSTNLASHKMVPSHRGMTYEVIEARPPELDADSPPLPTRWTDGQLKIHSDGVGLGWPPGSSSSDTYLSAQTDHHMPHECGIYYYEVRIEQSSRSVQVAVGVSGPKHDLRKLPGWETHSWAWHGDDGHKYSNANVGANYNKPCSKGDIIGCGVNFWTRTIFFTKNGHRLEDAFRDISDQKLRPSIGMKAPGACVHVNFGQESFKYNIADEVKREKGKIQAEISLTMLDDVLSGQTEDNFVKQLVAQFLRHGGYVETAKAFTAEVQTEHQALGTASSVSGTVAEDDIDAAQRQRIRSAILAGDVDRAIKCTQDFYPEVLYSNPIIHFRLKAMKFLEIVRLTSQIGREAAVHVSPLKKEKAKATLPGSGTMESAANFMELDTDPLTSGPPVLPPTTPITPSITWPTEPSSSPINHEGMSDPMETSIPHPVTSLADHARLELSGNPVLDLQTAIQEGQRLSEEYDRDPRREIRDIMQHIRGIWAYDDPTRSKEVGYLFEMEERGKVAEELNGAILGKWSNMTVDVKANLFRSFNRQA